MNNLTLMEGELAGQEKNATRGGNRTPAFAALARIELTGSFPAVWTRASPGARMTSGIQRAVGRSRSPFHGLPAVRSALPCFAFSAPCAPLWRWPTFLLL